ncbi:unnamed protein product [Rangifer tarandus platyrhynchus]|uniref:Uncharacterized protein n=1 Tax=Rangifer tarandus platyrhynchus TaxID=3082113 RepID=A0ABN8Z7N8_RANTA|nr:unnamed protein product [Rangifer tarandus platyrhynchus]
MEKKYSRVLWTKKIGSGEASTNGSGVSLPLRPSEKIRVWSLLGPFTVLGRRTLDKVEKVSGPALAQGTGPRLPEGPGTTRPRKQGWPVQAPPTRCTSAPLSGGGGCAGLGCAGTRDAQLSITRRAEFGEAGAAAAAAAAAAMGPQREICG